MDKAVAVAVRNFVSGKRKTPDGTLTVHKHTCVAGNHVWQCDSPYCDAPGDDDCPDHGGLEPIIQGREPWRGRN